LAPLFFAGYPLPVRLFGRLAAPKVAHQIRRLYRINAETVAAAKGAVDDAAARIERATGGDPGRYLAGDRLTFADISAASLLGPLVGPEGSPWTATAPIAALTEVRASLRARPAGA